LLVTFWRIAGVQPTTAGKEQKENNLGVARLAVVVKPHELAARWW